MKLPELCFVDQTDQPSFSNVIIPKLNTQPVHLFCSLTYITNNYSVLVTLSTMAKLAKAGFQLHVIYWDFNSLANPYFKRLFSSNAAAISQTGFIQARRADMAKILVSLGAPESAFTIYDASELWSRMVRIKEPNLFLQY